MIVCPYKDLGRYAPVIPGLEEAMKAIDAMTEWTPGTVPLSDGNRILVQEGVTKAKEEKLCEAHRKYLDVQYIAKGREAMGYLPLTGRETCAYDEAKDFVSVSCENGASCEDIARIPMTQGMFIVLYPQDGHQPKCMVDRPEPVVKIVVKVAVEA